VIISLDTNVMVDLVNRRRPEVRARYDDALARGDQIVTCALAAHELLFGATISARPEVHFARANELLADLAVVDLTYEDTLQAIPVRRALRRQGQSIGLWDLMIAGQALHRGWTVISHNLREFVRVEGLQTEDWAQPWTSS
jgi:tRNA(fMet)-specific endonuclease VapC